MSNLSDPRVLFAAERTLMAWNRTSLGLIAFGFVLERSGLLLRVLAPEGYHDSMTPITMMIGLVFICLGSVCAIVSSWQFSGVLTTLNPDEIPAGYKPRWGMAINIAVGILGVTLGAILTVNHLG